MSRRLPPLNPLRVFEAVARHGRAIDAAAELAVTPSAVSHQLKALEDHLGARLFDRTGQGLRLTPAAEALLPTLRRAFDDIARVAEEMRVTRLEGPLAVHAVPTFASRVVVRNLEGFVEAHPGIELSLRTHQARNPAIPRDFDVLVEYGWFDRRGSWVRQYGQATQFAACSPRLINRGDPPLRSPADLRHMRLLHDDDGSSWARWLAVAGVDGVDATRGLFFGSFALASEAAANGLGVILGDPITSADDLASGRLVRPFDLAVPSDEQYFIVVERSRLARPPVRAFLAWLWSLQGEPLSIEEGAAQSDMRGNDGG